MSISADGSVNGKNDGPEAHLELVVLEEAAQELGVHALQVGEADVLVDPQALRPDGTSASAWRRSRRGRCGPAR
jgi:hypothetical protein